MNTNLLTVVVPFFPEKNGCASEKLLGLRHICSIPSTMRLALSLLPLCMTTKPFSSLYAYVVRRGCSSWSRRKISSCSDTAPRMLETVALQTPNKFPSLSMCFFMTKKPYKEAGIVWGFKMESEFWSQMQEIFLFDPKTLLKMAFGVGEPENSFCCYLMKII